MKSLFFLLPLGLLAPLCPAQTVQTVPFDFTPNGTVNLNFNKFDSQGGTRQLLSVTISVDLNKMGGNTAIDNDSTESGSITVTHTISGQLSAVNNEVRLLDNSFTPIGGAGSLEAVSTLTTSVGPTTGDDDTHFNATLLGDYVTFSPEPTSASSSGMVNPLYNLDFVAGADSSFELQFDASQSASSSGLSGLQQEFTVSNVSGNVTVTYNFTAVPEQQTAALAGLAATGLLIRRRAKGAGLRV